MPFAKLQEEIHKLSAPWPFEVYRSGMAFEMLENGEGKGEVIFGGGVSAHLALFFSPACQGASAGALTASVTHPFSGGLDGHRDRKLRDAKPYFPLPKP